MDSLYDKLAGYQAEGIYPMHMPGHKRNTRLFDMPNPYSMDITEIEGFDDLHQPEEIILHSIEQARKLYGAKHTYYLVNGSTVGLLAGIMACTKKHDHVLVARNCHKAVYNAIYMHELTPVYLYPEFNEDFGCYKEVLASSVKKALEENEKISLVVLTSPTYEGIVSDIKAIAAICHEKKIPLLVDEAHGAHLGFHPYFPESALKEGADVVIQSVHKTLPAFTQTALLHCDDKLVDQSRIKRYLSMLQSSSPSYLLMAGIDQCIRYVSKNKETVFDQYESDLKSFYERMKALKHLTILTKPEGSGVKRDPSKIVIGVLGTTLSATELYDRLLNQYKIQLEMISRDYGIAMTSICDTKEGYGRLAAALLEIDGSLEASITTKKINPYNIPTLLTKLNPYEAMDEVYDVIPFEEAAGHISAEYIYFYPPGIPVAVPGEVISSQLLQAILEFKDTGIHIKGVNDASLQTLRVIKQKEA
ncbi:MAG: aminotransferase class I/II-fold pyridoxal phosphate-dependent enzyme [bacterium]|nr:aminotransferase class I/II-fold pyridoxal phosphate-dependent enzyme [bacterium]